MPGPLLLDHSGHVALVRLAIVDAIVHAQEVNFQAVDGEVETAGLRDVRRDLPKAVASMFRGPAAQRRACVDRLYAQARLMAVHAPAAVLALK